MIDWIVRWKWVLFGVIALAGVAAWLDHLWFKRQHSQDDVILLAAKRYGVEPALVRAVVWRESRFDPAAHGTKGEIGLMQIGALAAQEWAESERLAGFKHEDLFDAALNARAGTWYLGKMIRRYKDTDNPYCYALADYNAGRSHVLRWLEGPARTNSQVFLEQMDFPGTRRYIESILRKYRIYKEEEK